MATFKFTAAFTQTTGISTPAGPHRTGGWSEGWYANAASTTALLQLLTQGTGFGGLVQPLPGQLVGWLPARCLLLAVGASITKVRIQQVVPLGPSQSFAVQFPGQILSEGDVPQMALQVTCPSIGTNNIKRFTLRGIPDTQVTEGEYTPGMQFAASVKLFLNSLTGLLFFARDLGQPTFKIISIDINGLTTLETPHTLNIGDMIRILSTVESTTKKRRGGRYQVATVGPLNNQFGIRLWNFNPSSGGKVRKDATLYAQADGANANPDRVIVKKIGRPIGGYRGRRSKRP